MQTEVALRMATAGLQVTGSTPTRAGPPADPDFPGMEAPRTALPGIAGAAGGGGGTRVIICGHVDTVAAAIPIDGRPTRSAARSGTATCTAAGRWT